MATLLCQRMTFLRSLNSPARTFTVPATVRAAFHTTSDISSSPSRQRQITLQRTIFSQPPTVRAVSIIATIRYASSRSAATNSSSTAASNTLTWDRFFDLRRKRRWFNLGVSLVTAVTTVGLVAPMLATYDFDTWGALTFGIDPVLVMGISTFAVAAGGWLCGPAFGNTAFSIWAGRRGWSKLITEKEKNFYARIKRYRADPSASSPQNPIPDYYGEKIASVKDYRRWLKDQKAFNLKKGKNLI